MEDIQINSGVISPSDCLSEATELIRPDYWLFFAMALVFMLFTIVIGLIPYLGGFINYVVSGPIMCGIYSAILAQSKGQKVEFSMMFDGFSNFGSALLVVLFQNIPSIFMLLIGLLFSQVGSSSLMDILPIGESHGQMEIFSNSLIAFFLIIYIAAIVFYLLTYFSLQLIADRSVGIGQAISLSARGFFANIGGIILLVLFEGLLMILGALLICIGLLFVLPVIYAMNVVAYQKVFPPPIDDEGLYTPPSPSEYGGMFGTGT